MQRMRFASQKGRITSNKTSSIASKKHHPLLDLLDAFVRIRCTRTEYRVGHHPLSFL